MIFHGLLIRETGAVPLFMCQTVLNSVYCRLLKSRDHSVVISVIPAYLEQVLEQSRFSVNAL